MKLPQGKFIQSNKGDKTGNIWASKGINLDEEGVIKMSPRSIMIANRTDDIAWGTPNVIGRFATGDYLVATSDKNYNLSLKPTAYSVAVNTHASNPTTALRGGATFWQNLWFATDADEVFSRPVNINAAETWTPRISSLTTGVPHPLAVNVARQELCVGNGNVVKQYNTSYSGTTDLTIPIDFVVNGLAYNSGQMGVITRLGTSTVGQDLEARFFVWRGDSTGSNGDAGVGSDACIGIVPYKSTFTILTRAGQLLYWNGGGLQELASFPFYFDDKYLGDFLNSPAVGINMEADGDVIYINIPNGLNTFSRKGEILKENYPGGVWCFDPNAGLYHRYSPSISKQYFHDITSANINTTTNVFTTSGTIPDTGNIARITSFTDGTVVGGIRLNTDYFIIKDSSTTFRLAETKEDALAGDEIDITATVANTRIMMYDVVDYSPSYLTTGAASAIASVKESDIVKTGMIIGGSFFPLAMGAQVASLSISVPFLENRGWFITPKIYSSQVTDSAQRLFIKYRPLKEGDSIVVKYRNKEVEGLPTTNGTNILAEWLSPTVFTTTQDLSEAKAHLDGGGHLECELTAGAGGGQMSQIESIATDDNITYSVTLEDEVVGATNGRKSSFIINNWEVFKVITSADESPVDDISPGANASWSQFKIEMRGSDIAIEELDFSSDPYQQN